MAKSSFGAAPAAKKTATLPAKKTAAPAAATPTRPTPGAKAPPRTPTPAIPQRSGAPAAKQVSATSAPTHVPGKITRPPAGVTTNAGAIPSRPAGPTRVPARTPAPQQPAAEVQEQQAPEAAVDEILPPEEEQVADDEGVYDDPNTAASEALALPKEARVNLMAAPLGQVTGALDQGDFDFPRLKLAQYVGPLTEELNFTPGDWVLNDKAILWQEGYDGFELTFLKVVKQFCEQLDYGATEMPRIFNTKEEAEEAGLVVDWVDDVPPQVFPQYLCMVLIKFPGEGYDQEEFNIEFGEDLYALALWRISGSASKLIKQITGALRTRLKNGLHTGSFIVSAVKTKAEKSGNMYFAPVLRPGGAHGEELINFIQELAASNE